MTQMRTKPDSRGFSLVEIMVAVGIIVSVVTAAAGAWQLYFKVLHASADQTQAAMITEEAAEALNFLRDSGWSAYITPHALDTAYYLQWDGDNYSLSSLRVEMTGGYATEIAFKEVLRDASSNIITGGGVGVPDPRSRRAFITVTPIDDAGKILMQSEMLKQFLR